MQVTIRCIPFDSKSEGKKYVCCQNPGTERLQRRIKGQAQKSSVIRLGDWGIGMDYKLMLHLRHTGKSRYPELFEIT
ncbi:MAG: hypothetical protein R2941_17135 [Desulfobacterales bacterium]